MALPEHECGQALAKVAKKGCGVSSLGAIQNLTARGPEQPALPGPLSAGGRTRWPPEVSSNLDDSVIFMNLISWMLNFQSKMLMNFL